MRQWLVESGPQRASPTLSKAPLEWSRIAHSHPPCSGFTLMSSRLFSVIPRFQVMVVIYTKYWSPSFSLLMMWFFLLLLLRVFRGFWINLHLLLTWDNWLWTLRRLVLWSSTVWRPHISISIQGWEVEITSSYTYLGVKFSRSHFSLRPSIQPWISKGLGSLALLER